MSAWVVELALGLELELDPQPAATSAAAIRPRSGVVRLLIGGPFCDGLPPRRCRNPSTGTGTQRITIGRRGRWRPAPRSERVELGEHLTHRPGQAAGGP